MSSSLGELLKTLRNQQGFRNAHTLSDAADVSANYIYQIEAGLDPRTKKPPQPSPKVLRQLADALGKGDQTQASRFYSDLMLAAGYLPEALGEPQEVLASPLDSAPAAKAVAHQASPAPPAPSATPASRRESPQSDLFRPMATRSAAPTVALRDPRLQAHCRELLEGWESLEESEQRAFLALAELIAQRRMRRQGV